MKQYRTILADPPWPEPNEKVMLSGSGRKRQRRGFETMSMNDIDSMRVAKLALPAAHLYLWATQRSLEHAFSTMRAWDFNFKSLIVWCKPIGMSMYYYRTSTEFLLFGTRGKLQRLMTRNSKTWYEWPRGTHRGFAAKPDESYALIETNSSGPYLELFARRKFSSKWDVWGNEVRSSKHLREVLG